VRKALTNQHLDLLPDEYRRRHCELARALVLHRPELFVPEGHVQVLTSAAGWEREQEQIQRDAACPRCGGAIPPGPVTYCLSCTRSNVDAKLEAQFGMAIQLDLLPPREQPKVPEPDLRPRRGRPPVQVVGRTLTRKERRRLQFGTPRTQPTAVCPSPRSEDFHEIDLV
jgi:hypothetical protein